MIWMSFIDLNLLLMLCMTGNPASFSGLPVLISVNSNHLIVASIMENANALCFVWTLHSHSKQGLLTCVSPKPILVYGIADTWRTYEKGGGDLGRLTNSLAGTQRGNGDIYNRSFSFAKWIDGRLSRLLWLVKLNSTLSFVFLLYIFNYCKLKLDFQQPN